MESVVSILFLFVVIGGGFFAAGSFLIDEARIGIEIGSITRIDDSTWVIEASWLGSGGVPIPFTNLCTPSTYLPKYDMWINVESGEKAPAKVCARLSLAAVASNRRAQIDAKLERRSA